MAQCPPLIRLIAPYLEPKLVEARYVTILAFARSTDNDMPRPMYDFMVHGGLNEQQLQFSLRSLRDLATSKFFYDTEDLFEGLVDVMNADSEHGVAGPGDWFARASFPEYESSSSGDSYDEVTESDDGTESYDK